MLGAILGEAALAGKNKLTILSDPEWAPLGAWLEQLVAESSGKEGKGILPVDGEPFVDVENYGQDRIFIYLCANGSLAERAASLRKAGHPVLTISFTDPNELGGEFFRWCLAVSAACAVLGVNAFDQPDVQDSKTRTTRKIEAFQHGDALIEGNPVWSRDGTRIYSTGLPEVTSLNTPGDAVRNFASQAESGSYIAINAYLPRTPEAVEKLQTLRKQILEISRVPVTLGFGPRFLHSTGQLHKGGPAQAMFLEITADPIEDLPIPGQKLTFGTLQRAQALGDYEALQSRGRKVMRIDLGRASLESLIKS